MAGDDQRPDPRSNPDNEITVPNIFGGAPRDDDPAAILPGLSAREQPAPAAWEQHQQTGYVPGNARDPRGGYTAFPAAQVGAGGAGSGLPPTQLATLPPDGNRRRNALFGVIGVIGLTVAVVLAAILIAPKWSKNAQPDPTTPIGTASSEPSGSDSSDGQSSSGPPASTSAKLTTAAPPTTATSKAPASTSAPPHTVTVTATATGGGTGRATTTRPGKPTSKSAPSSTPKPTTQPKPTTPKPTKPKPTKPKPTKPKAPDLGVQQADIACSGGYIVQLASELDQDAFRARVSSLKAQGMVPPDARAADSTKSCGIFANQRNTWVLYAGPFASPYDGCRARLGGPADAFIKGANPDTAHGYFSCVCPANPAQIPGVGPGSNQHAWIGELQRVLANRLNYSVGPLGPGEWGVYTPGTQQAVRKFQADHKLPPTGSVDARTWSALRGAQC